MPQTTTIRRQTELLRTRPRRRDARRWYLAALALVLLAAALWLFTRDTRWSIRQMEARERGLAAELNSQPVAARAAYEEALATNPYDWETHLSLAGIFYHWLNNHEGALRHYLLAMAYCPDPAMVDEISRAAGILSLIRDGSLENPADAIEDLFQAAETEAEHLFLQRLGPDLRGDFDLFWKTWRERGRGIVVYQTISLGSDGRYDAGVEITFPDGVDMFLRLGCRRRDIWRLNLSFP